MPRRLPSLVALTVVCLACAHVWTQGRVTHVDWRAHGANPAHTQHSPADLITPANVGRLQVAWTYHTGDGRADNRSQIQCNPIVVDGVLYASSAQLKVFALDAATGTPKWVFDPFASAGKGDGPNALGVSRGVTYWADGSDKRILMGAGPYLYAIDADTGTPIATFGNQGRIDLRLGLDADTTGLSVLSNTPGSIYKDLIIVPTRLSEGPGRAAPGHIRAFDARTGERRWIFHTIPRPGQPGHETWPTDAWQRIGGANNWAGMAVDDARGMVFVPTGSAAFDFWGGNRLGANLYANSLLALKADTGELVWHFQFVHHDLWDRDLPTAPVLGTVTKDGRAVDVVMQATKTGELFVFERATGTPLHPIEEVPVPPSTLTGEVASPTQPRSSIAFTRQSFSPAMITSRTPQARAFVLKQLEGAKPYHKWQPPSEEGTIIFPGFDGGAEWGGQAFDPASGTFFVNGNDMAWITHMLPIDRTKETTQVARGRRQYQVNCVACHGLQRQGDPSRAIPTLVDIDKRQTREAVADVVAYGRGQMPPFSSLSEAVRNDIIAFLFNDTPKQGPASADDALPEIPYVFGGYTRLLDDKGYPGVTPPWGTLTAIDVAKGAIKWQVTLGDRPEARGPKDPPTGTENYGGPAITAGGVLFIGATNDEKFRAFDMKTGRTLWEASLPAGGYATPATYVVNGRQYVVIAAGGGKMGTKSGDTYVAYALPDGGTTARARR